MLNYYHILSSDITSDEGMFRVALNADCEVYQGHFPGEPVCPGVCNIQMIKECAEIVLQGGAVVSLSRFREPHQESMLNTEVRPGDRTSMCSETPTMLLSHIRQCRLTTLVTPQQHPEVEVRVAILSRSEDTITFRGTIGKGEEVYMELKGELKG
ncbi:MAG: hypothetical protein ACI30J_01905 [Paludibacteraceae bacterium]